MDKYINVEPVYEQTTKAMGESLVFATHEKPATCLFSILDQFRYLMETDKPAAMRVMRHFGTMSEMEHE